MRKYLTIGLFVVTVAIVTGCGTKTPAPTPQTTQAPTTQNTPAPTSPSPTTVASGKDVYDKNCASCHGAGGAGGMSPALNDEKRTQAEVLAITTAGKGNTTGKNMPAFATKLTPAEIIAVSKYVADMKK